MGLKKLNLYRYIVILSIIMMALIIGMSAYVYHYYYSELEKNFYELNKQTVETFADAHDSNLQVLQDIATQIYLSGANTRFKLDEQPQKVDALKQQLYEYRAVSQFYDCLYYHYQGDIYLYNHATSVSVDRFSDIAYSWENYTSDEIRNILNTEQRNIIVLPEENMSGKLFGFYNENSPAATYILPVPPSYDGVLLFIISSSHFDKILEVEADENRRNYILYNNEIVATRGNIDIDEDIVKNISDEESQKVVKINGKNYLLTIIPSMIHGFTYCSFQPTNALASSVFKGSWAIFGILIIACASFGSILYFSSRKILNTIKTVNKMLKEDEEDFYDLENIEKGIQALLLSNEEIKENYIKNFLHGGYTEVETLKQDAENAKIDITKAIDYMKANFANPDLTMATLAEYMEISAVTLSVEFKNGMGVSPSEYLAALRMEEAKTLLKTTNKKVKEVANLVGYEDDHVFMRRFKKYTGKTPGQFREE